MTFSRRQKRIMEELEKLKTLLNSFEPVTVQKAINEIEEVKQETNVIIPEVVQVVEKKKSVGCPLKFTCKEEMQVLGEKYFKECKENNEPLTITGLALGLGFNSRQSLLNYAENGEFLDTIKNLKTRVENYAEKQAFSGKNPSGAIFVLKNHGWKDENYNKNTNVNANVDVNNLLDNLE